MIEQFRVAAVRSIKQLAEVLKPVERFYPLIGAIGTEPIYDLDETFFEGLACQIQVTVRVSIVVWVVGRASVLGRDGDPAPHCPRLDRRLRGRCRGSRLGSELPGTGKK